jgi:hypothetical protein
VGNIPGISIDLYAQTNLGQQKLSLTWIDIRGGKEKTLGKDNPKTHELYECTPKLHPRYTPINNVKLKDRINRRTTHLIRWLARVRHQKRSSKILFQRSEETQLTIPEAFRWARVRAKIHDYPP